MEPEKPEPNLVSEGDQRGAELRGVLAPLLGAYMAGLVAVGFERHEAFDLVSDYHRQLLENHWNPDG